MKNKFLNLHLTEEYIGCVVYIHDPRIVGRSGLYIISGVNGSYENEPITTIEYTPSNLKKRSGYRLRVNGQWRGVEGEVVLGITEIYTKEKNPEYYL